MGLWWWQGQHVGGGSDCEACDSFEGCCFGVDSIIRVTWVGKCRNGNKTAYCTSFTRTTDFVCEGVLGGAPPTDYMRWSFTENGATSWIEYNHDLTYWTYSFAEEHWPHYDPIEDESLCVTPTGCTCDVGCAPLPLGTVFEETQNIHLYKLNETPLPADFCDVLGQPCEDLDPFVCIHAEVINCLGENPDPLSGIYCLGFYLQFSECCVID